MYIRKFKHLIMVLLWLVPMPSWAEEHDSVIQKGIAYYNTGNYEEAIHTLLGRLREMERLNNKKAQKVIFNNLGNSYANTGKVKKALECYERAISLAEEMGDKKSAAGIIKNVGALYSENKDFEKALEQFNDAQKLSLSIHDTLNVADCANNKGLVYEQQKKYDDALKEYTIALQIYQHLKLDDRIALLYNNLAIVYKYQENYDKAISFHEQSIETGKKLGDKFLIAANQVNIGNIYDVKGDYKKAISFISAALATAKEINANEIIMEAYNSLAETYSKNGDYKTGFEYYKTYTSTKDSFINVERSKQMAEMRAKYEAAQKEKQIVDKENKIIALEKARYRMLAAIGIMVLLMVIAYLLYNRQRIRQRQAHEKALLDAEYKERLRIAKDVHDDLGSGLSRISIMAGQAQNRNASQDELRDNISRISYVSRDLVGNMRDLIWVLNPENTTLDNLAARLREYCAEYLEGLPVEVHLIFPEYVPMIPITRDAQHNIFATVKEAVNNCVKHSRGNEIWVVFDLSDQAITLSIQDNGNGFNENHQKTAGNGIRNMRHRIESIGGSLNITSGTSGTTIKIWAEVSSLRVNPKNTTIV